MAPKKAPAAKEAAKPDNDEIDAKGKDAKDATATPKEAKESAFDKQVKPFKRLLKKQWAYKLAVALVLGIYVAAIIFVIMLSVGEDKSSNLHRAVEIVREFMIRRNESLLESNDAEILIEAEKAAQVLAESAKKLHEIEIDIEDARKRLKNGWIANKDAMYLYNTAKLTWKQSNASCAAQGSSLVKVDSEEEEIFLEKKNEKNGIAYWLSIWKDGYEYIWDVDKTLIKITYWAKNEPSKDYFATELRPVCGLMKPLCITPLQCWQTIDCNGRAGTLCGLKAKRKWLT
ncbi:oxidized low-density lipoprotein receptor 1-like [Anolis sagrei]|uniref:oxidized low-density lipoprotein receptor 1-like n=1 Tax=Anolis sagrei TaxID=38937 RepID=UPI00351FC071